MSVVWQNIRTDDHSDGSLSEVMSRLDLDPRLPLGAKEEISRSLNVHVHGEEESRKSDAQFVFQGQCLVLGDATVGKTSLVKSLTGKPFDAGEPRTQGIESSLVDRKWTNLDIDEGLKFGAFRRFKKGLVRLFAVYGPGKTQETTVEIIDKIPSFLLVIQFFLLFIIYFSGKFLDEHPILFLTFSLFCTIIYSSSIINLMGRARVFAKVVSIIRLHEFMMGKALAHVVAGYVKGMDSGKIIFCSNVLNDIIVASDWRTILNLSAFIVMTFMFNFLLHEYLMDIWFSSTGQWLSIVKAQRNIPGQKASVNIIFFLLLYTFRPSLASLFSGIIVGGLIETFTNIYNCNPPLLIHFAIAAICISLIQQLVSCLRFRSAISLVHVIISFISAYFLFYTSSFFLAVFVLIFNRVGCADWSYIICSFLNLEYDNIVQQNITFLDINKRILNSQKLKYALNKKFSSLKLKILDFAGLTIICFLEARQSILLYLTLNVLRWIISETMKKFKGFVSGWNRSVSMCNRKCQSSLLERTGVILTRPASGLCTTISTDNFGIHSVMSAVENSKGQTDTGIQILKERIVSIAEDYKTTIGRDIPYSWIKIQDAIIDQRERKEAKFCVTLKEFSTAFDEFICSNWSKETLKYFHEKGLVIYIDKDPELCKWVLLKPEILVDIIIQLVTPPPEDVRQRGFRTDWMLLQDKGMLTESLLNHILSRVQENEEAMTAFLVAYDLICPLSHSCINRSKDTSEGEEQQQATHFVPSLLPLSADRNCVTSVWNDAPEDKKFYVFFERFLPEPLFHRLLSRAHKNSVLQFRKCQPILFRGVGRFWMSCWQPYRLRLLKEENMIEVTFSCSSKDGMEPSNVLLLVFTMIEGICKRDFPFVKFHCGPACPSDRCPGHQDNYTSISCGQQTGTRRHVFNVMPARKDDVMISLYCVNHNFEAQLREWLP